MPSIRIGYGSDFSVSGANVGIGTTVTNAKLQVSGAAKADFNITGVTTLTAYSGFVAEKQNIFAGSKIGFNTVGLGTIGVGTLTQYYETESEYTKLENFTSSSVLEYKSLSGDLIVDDGKIFSIQDTEMVGFTTLGEYSPHTHKSSVCLGSLENLSVRNHFSVPCGEINDRQNNAIEGSVRFNDDLNTLEFYNGIEWKQFNYNQGQSGRGIVGDTGTGNRYQYFNIHTLGNTQDFGGSSIDTGGAGNGGGSNGIRVVWSGGTNPSNGNTIEYNTIASAGNPIDFGNLLAQSDSGGTVASSTRAVICGALNRTGAASGKNVMEYIEIHTLGNAIDFGDTITIGNSQCDGMSSPTRGFFEGGGYPASDNSIAMFTIASKGNAINFGEASVHASYKRNVSSTTRGIACGGRVSYPAGPFSDTIDYIAMASTGNAIDFGNLTQGRHSPAGAGTLTRGVFCGGYCFSSAPSTAAVNTMDYITIASTGDAIDFGDCSFTDSFMHGASDSHGGLGGF